MHTKYSLVLWPFRFVLINLLILVQQLRKKRNKELTSYYEAVKEKTQVIEDIAIVITAFFFFSKPVI
jgi:hypothetical protein